jgi:hypothetical protein
MAPAVPSRPPALVAIRDARVRTIREPSGARAARTAVPGFRSVDMVIHRLWTDLVRRDPAGQAQQT